MATFTSEGKTSRGESLNYSRKALINTRTGGWVNLGGNFNSESKGSVGGSGIIGKADVLYVVYPTPPSSPSNQRVIQRSTFPLCFW